MHLLPPDAVYLDRALALAEQAAAFASPNPTVGCVLTRNGHVLGEGAHFYEARDHAEIAALKAAKAAGWDLAGATAYVTLEPCSHHGRTGPCADALIAAGIQRCVVATLDPNPLVRGRGLAKLKAAGIHTDLLTTDQPATWRARRLNDAFAFSVQHGRPFVTLKTAISQDGKLAPPTSQRTETAPVWLTGAAARQEVQLLRHQADALVTGIGTVLADDPSLTDRTGLPRRRPLLRVILDSDLRTPVHAKVVTSSAGALLVFTTHRASPEREAALRRLGVEVYRLPEAGGALEPSAVLALLESLQVRNVLLEAGSRVNAAFLRQDLVDRLVLYTAPMELGPEGLHFASGITLKEVTSRLTSPEQIELPHDEANDLRLTGYFHDPWSAIGN